MNDRYLYRAKRKNWRELPEEKWWVEGYYAYMKPYHYIMPKDNFDSWIEIDEKTLCACTGLKDKNGKMIWENDIVSVNDTLYVCRFDEDNFEWEFQNHEETIGICCFHSSDIEIVGNAIDNTETVGGWRMTIDEALNILEPKLLFPPEFNEAISLAKEAMNQYRSIGTPEECREAVEKQRAKKPKQQGIVDSNGKFHTWNGINGKPYLLCPNCGTNLCCEMPYDKKPEYCDDCGQKLDWSDEE